MTTASRVSSQSEVIPAGEWITPGRFAALLGVLISLMFWDVIFGSATFFFRDFGVFGYPLAHYNRDSIWQGELPFWNPLNNCGLPYIAQWNTMVFYPLSLFHLLLPLSWSLAVFNLGHMFLAGCGMYFLAQRWSGSRLAAAWAGLTFAFSGLMLNCLMWPNNIAAMAWLPWVLWRAEKAWREGGREIWIAATVGATQMLSGGAEIIGFTWLMAGTLMAAGFVRPAGLGRMSIAFRFGLVALMVASLTAMQLLPFLDLLWHSQRDVVFGDSRWSMPEWGWANLILPLFRARLAHNGVHVQPEQYWTSSYYLGVGVILLLVSVAPRLRSSWLWWATGLGGLMMALGDGGILYQPLKTLFPALGMMRFPVKFVVLTTVALPILSAQALASYLRLPAGNWQNAFARLLGGAALLGLCLAGLLWWAQTHGQAPGTWNATLNNALVRAALLVLFLVALFVLRSARRPIEQIGCAVGLLVLCWIDLSSHMPNQNPTAPRSIYARDLVDSYLPSEPRPVTGGSRAMLTPLGQQELRFSSLPDPSQHYPSRRATLLSNCNLLDGVPKVNGFYSLYPAHHADLIAALYIPTNVTSTGLLDFMGVSHLTSGHNVFDWEGRSSFMPMLAVGPQPVFAGQEETFAAVTAPEFNPKLHVYLPAEARPTFGMSNRISGKIVRSAFKPHRIDATVWAESPTVLTIAQTYYHGWSAYVNGEPTRIWRANHGFQALRLPAGSNQVHLVYRERTFGLGLAVSILAMMTCFLGWKLSPRRGLSPALSS